MIVSSLAKAQAEPWRPKRFEDLDPGDFENLLMQNAELVIFGSGHRLRFAQPQWLLALMARGIGVETMDTAAASRTYNILASEGRKVTAALLIESESVLS